MIALSSASAPLSPFTPTPGSVVARALPEEGCWSDLSFWASVWASLLDIIPFFPGLLLGLSRVGEGTSIGFNSAQSSVNPEEHLTIEVFEEDLLYLHMSSLTGTDEKKARHGYVPPCVQGDVRALF